MSVAEAIVALAAAIIVGGALLKGVLLILQRGDTSATARFDPPDPLAEPRAGLEALDSGGVSLLSGADTRTLPVLARITGDQAAPTRRRRPLLDAFASGGMSLLLDGSSSGASRSSDKGGGAPSAPVA